jgi:hypothetical protein
VTALLKPLWHVRYVFVFLPFHLGGLGGLLAALRPSARIAAVTVAVTLSLPGLVEEKRVPGRTPWREAAAHVAARECRAVCLIGPSNLGKPFGWYYKRPFEVVPGAAELVVAARRAAEAGGRVLIVYCDAHAPPDPRREGARELATTLEARDAAHFGPLHVYEFARRPR